MELIGAAFEWVFEQRGLLIQFTAADVVRLGYLQPDVISGPFMLPGQRESSRLPWVFQLAFCATAEFSSRIRDQRFRARCSAC
jgi:hypothetical protein